MTVIWSDFEATEVKTSLRGFGGALRWYKDLERDKQRAGVMHLAKDRTSITSASKVEAPMGFCHPKISALPDAVVI